MWFLEHVKPADNSVSSSWIATHTRDYRYHRCAKYSIHGITLASDRPVRWRWRWQTPKYQHNATSVPVCVWAWGWYTSAHLCALCLSLQCPQTIGSQEFHQHSCTPVYTGQKIGHVLCWFSPIPVGQLSILALVIEYEFPAEKRKGALWKDHVIVRSLQARSRHNGQKTIEASFSQLHSCTHFYNGQENKTSQPTRGKVHHWKVHLTTRLGEEDHISTCVRKLGKAFVNTSWKTAHWNWSAVHSEMQGTRTELEKKYSAFRPRPMETTLQVISEPGWAPIFYKHVLA